MEFYYNETLAIIAKRKQEIADKFEQECLHLLKSGAIERDSHNRGLLFGVAIENIADGYLRGERTKKEYKNLKRF